MQYSLEQFNTGNDVIDSYPDAVSDSLLTANYELKAENGNTLIDENGEVLLNESYMPDQFTVDGEVHTESQNAKFDVDISDILDFSERNPFGEVARA